MTSILLPACRYENVPRKIIFTPPREFSEIVAVLPSNEALINTRGQLNRLNADGSLGAEVIPRRDIQINGQRFLPDQYLLLEDGKFLAGGSLPDNPNPSKRAVARLLPDGQPDASFGFYGRTEPLPGDFDSFRQLLRVQPDGKILVISNAAYNPFRIFLARFYGDILSTNRGDLKR